jgi:alpha-beta hydrolase superfamily lysophospholipase
MHGEKDPRVSVPQVRSIYENLAGCKELVLFPRAGHESYLENDSEQWNYAVQEFLRRVEKTIKPAVEEDGSTNDPARAAPATKDGRNHELLE